jgi:nucleotide-binding universal stress UspA family protein
MFEKVLVPLDGSSLAECALEPAISLTEEGQRELILLSVPAFEKILLPTSAGNGFTWPEQLLELARNQSESYLAEVAGRLATPELKIRTEVREGDVASAIVDAAAAEGAGLVVMSTHGYSGLTRWVLGSITEKVLRAVACPVLVVRSPTAIGRILLTLDGSRLAETALEPTLEVAAALEAQVTLLRVVDFDNSSYEEAKDYLHGMAERCRSRATMGPAIVMFGPAPQSILEVVQTHHIDLVAMATHGRSGIRRWVYGSVTEKVLRTARRAMLIVRPSAHELN